MEHKHNHTDHNNEDYTYENVKFESKFRHEVGPNSENQMIHKGPNRKARRAQAARDRKKLNKLNKLIHSMNSVKNSIDEAKNALEKVLPGEKVPGFSGSVVESDD